MASKGTKLKTGDIIESLDEVMRDFDEMEKKTVSLRDKTASYNESLSDGVMEEMVDILDRIGETIADIKAKIYAFAKDKKEAVEGIEDTYGDEARMLKKIRR